MNKNSWRCLGVSQPGYYARNSNNYFVRPSTVAPHHFFVPKTKPTEPTAHCIISFQVPGALQKQGVVQRESLQDS